MWINGGFFAFRPRDLRPHAARRGARGRAVPAAHGERPAPDPRHEGFWACIDTFKDKVTFDAMIAKGDTPWMRWKIGHAARARREPGADARAEARSGAARGRLACSSWARTVTTSRSVAVRPCCGLVEAVPRRDVPLGRPRLDRARADEAERRPREFLAGAARTNIAVESFRDGFLPYHGRSR